MTLPELTQHVKFFSIYIVLIGQGLYLAMYATRQWAKFRLTRSMMLKSFSFFLTFVESATIVAVMGTRSYAPFPVWLLCLMLTIDTFVMLAVWYQAYALALDIRAGWLMKHGAYIEAEENENP